MDNKYYKLDLEDLEDLEDLGDSGKITVEKRRKNGVVEKRQVKFKPLRFTKKNRDLILACIDIDSTYRRSFDEENPNSSAHYIVEWFGDKNKYENEYLKKSREEKIKIMFEVCYRLDKENSTHLSVSSSTKGENANKGVELMASAIVDKCVDKEGKSNILKALETDTEGKIVYNISQFVSYQNKKNEDGNDKIRNNLSFASKFCTFMCRYAFDETDENHDKFSIYDSVLCNILPYYMWKYQKYLDEDKKLTKNMLTKDKVIGGITI